MLSPYLGFGGSFVAAPVAVAMLGVVIERTLFRRFYRSDPILSLLMTFGLAMVAEQGLRMIFGAAPLSYSIPPWLRGQVFLGSFIYSFYRVVLLGIAAACIAGTLAAAAKNLVRPRGARRRAEPRHGRRARYLAAALYVGRGRARHRACGPRRRAAGADLFHPSGDGQEIITPAFVVVVIGGLGSFWGVVAAALLVGLVKGVMVGIGYSAASTAAIYLLMLLVLLFRPRGLFGERILRFE